MSLYPGIYDKIINKDDKDEIERIKQLNPNLIYSKKIDPAEASKILSMYTSSVLQLTLTAVAEKYSDDKKIEQISEQISLVNSIIELIKKQSKDNLLLDNKKVDISGEKLLAVLSEKESFLDEK